MSNTTQTPMVPAGQLPAMLLTPLDWALETQRLAAEYAGLPEGKEFLVNSRRMMALAARLSTLETENETLKSQVERLENQIFDMNLEMNDKV